MGFFTFPNLRLDFYVNSLAATSFLPNKIRMHLYRSYGLKIGEETLISPRCYIAGRNVVIGQHSYLNYECFLDAGPIVIGDYCSLGMGVLLCTSGHAIGPSDHRSGLRYQKKVIVGDGCWIGARSVILPGVTIGHGTIIGAGSVVTKDCEADSLYCGNPARLVRRLAPDGSDRLAELT